MLSGNVIILEEVPATVWCGWTQEKFCPLDKYFSVSKHRWWKTASPSQTPVSLKLEFINLLLGMQIEHPAQLHITFIEFSSYLLTASLCLWMDGQGTNPFFCESWQNTSRDFWFVKGLTYSTDVWSFFAELYTLLLSFRLNSLAVWVTFWICGPHWLWREQNSCLRMNRYLFVEKCNQIWWM